LFFFPPSPPGGVTVDIRGIGLCTLESFPFVRFGTSSSVCDQPEITVPHLHLRCSLPPTVRSETSTTVTVSVGRVGSASTKDERSTFLYQPPTINSLSPTSGAMYGDWTLEFPGENFGRNSHSTTVLVGGLACRDIDLDLVDERHLRCVSPPFGPVPGETTVVVIVGGVTSQDANIGMTGPAVDIVSPSEGPSYGGNVLLVSGGHLADLHNNVHIELTVGGRKGKSTNVVAQSESHVECVAPGECC